MNDSIRFSDSQHEYFKSILSDVIELYDGDDLNVELFVEAFNRVILGCFNCYKETNHQYVFDRTMNHYKKLLESKSSTASEPVNDLNEGFADMVESVVPEIGE